MIQACVAHQYNVNIIFTQTPQDVNEIMGSGKVDLGFKAMIHTLAATARGFPVTTIAYIGI